MIPAVPVAPSIPSIDIRDKAFADFVRQEQARGRLLLEATKDSFSILSRILSGALLPVGDRVALRWLEKTANPYLAEIRTSAEILDVPGIYALNLSYEWGCTSGVFNAPAPVLLRVLDWPFPGLGEHMAVVHQRGPAGDFANITWPGVSGIFQAVAVGRFAAALNQAPMRRHGLGYPLDWVKNRKLAFSQTALPPAHLLRQVFEQAKTYGEARRMLAETPVSIPVIYILSGLWQGEGCVIERTETAATIRELDTRPKVVAANHFIAHQPGGRWSPREVDSTGRAACMDAMTLDAPEKLDWFKAPIANVYTRLVMVTDAVEGALTLMGTYGATPVTELTRQAGR